MSKPIIAHWLTAPLRPDVAQSLERLFAAEDVRHIAVMPDVHLSGDVCVGVALATQRLIYPAAVGGDIGCGMAAIAVQAAADLLDDRTAGGLLAGLARRVPAMRHSRRTMPELPKSLLQSPLGHPRLTKLLERDGRVQLGTLGRGNHFLEFQSDQDDRLWIMLHSGSRAMGQAITVHHVAVAKQRKSPPGQLQCLDVETPEGAAYLADVAWAIRYANESRLAMLRATEQLLQDLFGVSFDWPTLIHADHNHVRRETHFGQSLLVHRKGALPAAADQPGVIPGSMGSASFHVTGRGCELSLGSSSHGAGRAFSRSQAAQRIQPRQLLREMRGVWFDDRLARQLCDEAPSAYKDVRAVMRAQRELTRIERELRPLLSYKGC
jgi:tRNA-splicing ligase RtcB